MIAPNLSLVDRIQLDRQLYEMAARISDAADLFEFWAREQPLPLRRAAGQIDRQPVYALKEAIEAEAEKLDLDKIVPTTLAEVIALLEYDGLVERALDALRAIAEREREP